MRVTAGGHGDWPDIDLASDDFTGLAAYVTPGAIAEVWSIGIGSGSGSPEGRSASDREAVARDLVRQMASRGFVYDLPLRTGVTEQRVRHIHEALRSRATCLDLALVYAGLCELASLYAFVVILDDERLGFSHAIVAVLCDRDGRADVVGALGGAGATTYGGQWRARDVGPLDAFTDPGVVLLVDPTEVAHGLPVEEAERRALDADSWERPWDCVSLVDIPWLRLRGTTSHRPSPWSPVGLTTQIALATAHFHDYPSRTGLVDELAASSGLVVLQGPSGCGKTTLALEIAERADRGFGWVLRGDDERSVTASLARRFA
jgi:hypothetical protein